MAAIRLNYESRGDILRALLDHKFKARADELTKRESELAVAVYDEAYAPYKEIMEKLPKGAFRTDTSIYAATAGRQTTLFFGRDKDGALHSRPMFAAAGSCHVLKNYPADSEMGIKLFAWMQDKEVYRAEYRAARAEIDAALSQFRSFDKLMAAWPEADSIVRPIMAQYIPASSPVPVVRLKDLNKMLGLPPEKKEEDQCSSSQD